jgi:hypothetical protein
MSAFVVWATQELERFGMIFRRQVFYCNDFRTIAECLEIARVHCSVLEDKGLSLSFFLWQMFRPNTVQLINTSCYKIEAALSRQLVDDPCELSLGTKHKRGATNPKKRKKSRPSFSRLFLLFLTQLLHLSPSYSLVFCLFFSKWRA